MESFESSIQMTRLTLRRTEPAVGAIAIVCAETLIWGLPCRRISNQTASRVMRRPLISLMVVVGLFVLGGLTVAPYTPTKWRVAADGTRTQRAANERRFAEWRVNWFAYICFAGAAASFTWTLYLVSAGIVSIVRARRHDNAIGKNNS
jgi:fatty acid desaturase